MKKTPINFQDIVALISFEDVGPIPACGYAVTAEDGTINFYTKLPHGYVPWDRVLSWKYLADIWPSYNTEGIDYDR
jgi:hypothetical protein